MAAIDDPEDVMELARKKEKKKKSPDSVSTSLRVMSSVLSVLGVYSNVFGSMQVMMV